MVKIEPLDLSSLSTKEPTLVPVSPPRSEVKWHFSKHTPLDYLRHLSKHDPLEDYLHPESTETSTKEDGNTVTTVVTAASMAREITARKKRPKKLKISLSPVTTVDTSAIYAKTESDGRTLEVNESRGGKKRQRRRKQDKLEENTLIFAQHLPEDGRHCHLLKYGDKTEEPFLALSIRRWTAAYIEYLPENIIKRAMLEDAKKRELRKKSSIVRLSLASSSSVAHTNLL